MATWNVGPFDNGDAVEWCDRLEAIPASRRVKLVMDTLAAAAAHSGQLPDRVALEVAAAAATVLQLQTGAADDSTPYAPRFLTEAEAIPVTVELRELARAALRVLLAEGSSWRAQWVGHIEEEQAVDVLSQLYDGLTHP